MSLDEDEKIDNIIIRIEKEDRTLEVDKKLLRTIKFFDIVLTADRQLTEIGLPSEIKYEIMTNIKCFIIMNSKKPLPEVVTPVTRENFDRFNEENELNKYYTNFLTLGMPELIELSIIADYLMLDSLIDICMARIAINIADLNTEMISSVLRIPDPIPAEKQFLNSTRGENYLK